MLRPGKGAGALFVDNSTLPRPGCSLSAGHARELDASGRGVVEHARMELVNATLSA